MKIKVSDTTNNQLNWLVAKCEGVEAYFETFAFSPKLMIKNPFGDPIKCPDWTTDWRKCDSIIENNSINIVIDTKYCGPNYTAWIANIPNKHNTTGHGPTPSIAALRCYVISKLGNVVSIPDNLCYN